MDTTGFNYCPFCGDRLLSARQSRAAAPTCQKCNQSYYSAPHPTVSAIILDETEQSVLLTRRAVEPFKGSWDIPGGFLEPGESLEEGLARELAEELGIQGQIRQHLCNIPDLYYPTTPTINLFYVLTITAGKPNAGSDVAECRWFPRDQIPAHIAFESGRRAVAAWLRS